MHDYPLIVQVGISESALTPMYQRRNLYYSIAGVLSLFVLYYMNFSISSARRQRLYEHELQAGYEKLSAAHEELAAREEELRHNYIHLNNERAFSTAVIESVPGC